MLIDVSRPVGRADRRAHYTIGEAAAITSFRFSTDLFYAPAFPPSYAHLLYL